MKLLRLSPAFTLFLCFSCGDENQSQTKTDSIQDTTHVVADSLPAPDTMPSIAIASGMGGDTILPSDKSLVFFSFTKKLTDNKNKPLSAKEVNRRFSPMDPHCEAEAAWTFQRFFFLDSLKKIGEEPEHDMGQTVKVEIHEYDTIKKTSSETWIVWTMWYETEQACPYATGTYFMLSTYDANGKLVSTQCMGRDCGGADAPLQWVSVQESNIFTDGSFRGILSDTSGEDDFRVASDLSIMRKTFTGMIAQGGKITTTVKEIERNE